MEIERIEAVLANAHLELIPIRALLPTREPYNVMLLQPQGAIEANEERIGHADKAFGHDKCLAFLLLAASKHADLVVTPEYCLPWSVAEKTLEGSIHPDEGAIWVLGCESITPAELAAFRLKVIATSAYFYHEPIDEIQKAKKRYIDPLLYVFWSINSEGNKVLAFVVQFKTAPCKDSLDVEQRSLYLGKKVYSFNREINKIGLLAIICSDAFEFTNDLIDDYHANCLLIHIQLNPEPAHGDYAAYRAHLYAAGSNSNVELLCLNWAKDIVEVTSDGNKKLWNNVAGSAWYVPASKFSGDDQLINEAHHRGIYYSIVSQRWHTFYLNYEPQALLLQKQKLLLFAESQALCPKSCLSGMERWCWDISGKWIEKSSPDDGLASLLATYPALLPHLPDQVKVSAIGVERALELLMGPTGKATTWFNLQELPSMKVEIEESICRVTVHQEDDMRRKGVLFRRARLQRAQDAMTLAGSKIVPWPKSIRDLENGFTFFWTASLPHYNVAISGDLKRPASLAYLADQSDDTVVDGVYTKLLQAISVHAISSAFEANKDPTDAAVRAKDRLCVVFRRDHAYRVWKSNDNNQFNRPPDHSAVDIAGEP